MRHFSLPKDGGLIEENLPKGILHSFEKINTEIFDDAAIGSDRVADIVVKAIKDHEKAALPRPFKLGLTTGRTPISLYSNLTRQFKEGKVSFANVEVFSIDEYYPCGSDSIQSRNHRLHDEFLDQVDVRKENIHIPDGSVSKEEISDYCAEFDRIARGIDLLVIGVGEGGQVGFNEAGSTEKSVTRTVPLSYISRKRQAHNFNGDIAVTPKAAITMGIGTMMSARRIILMAWGEDKAKIVHKIVEEDIDSSCPASWLQSHNNISFFTDEMSASLLTRSVAPWKVGPCEWTPKLIRKAVVWLCQKVHKPILKLTQGDYLSNGLGELLEKRNVASCEPVNRLPVVAHAEEFRQRTCPTERLQESVSVKGYVLEFIHKNVIIIRAMTVIAESGSLNDSISEIYGILLPAHLLIALHKRDDNAGYGLTVAAAHFAAQLLN